MEGALSANTIQVPSATLGTAPAPARGARLKPNARTTPNARTQHSAKNAGAYRTFASAVKPKLIAPARTPATPAIGMCAQL